METPSPSPEDNGKVKEPATEGAKTNTEREEDNSPDVTVKEIEIHVEQNSDAGDRSSESDGSSEAVNEVASMEDPRPDSRTELVTEKEANMIPNGDASSDNHESFIPLIPNPKPSPSRTSWRGLKRSLSKNSDEVVHSSVHTEARLSSADFNVAVVTYKRSASQDYTKVDIHDQEDDEDHSAHYTDISTSWATSFWTQFSVLMVRTFKQSKPDILSKLNFVQVSKHSVLHVDCY